MFVHLYVADTKKSVIRIHKIAQEKIIIHPVYEEYFHKCHKMTKVNKYAYK